ncbi:exodeoxyribonuclease VII large subunit [Aquabacterium sp.]|uniref:exodeoxyribonuclease VII large subunit n=1 Tax=Aquabacterium sp. TaxID=1872578 RepID=UPI0035B3A5A8
MWQQDREDHSPRVWGVQALVQAVGDSLSARFGGCVVRGEISGFTRAASGHGYFTLKDEHGQAALRCAMFRRALSQVDFTPSEGMLVEVRGNLAVYEARGELQMVIESMRRAGAGALYEQFLRLKAKLEAEGLFASERKRAMPAYPKRVAVVTSLAAAALRDVLTALARRAPHVEVWIAPTSVQGAEAPAQIVSALAEVAMAHHAGQSIDAVLLVRGGGSLEDLWAFNDERVVRAVAACAVPVICGVGHETDVTLADFAADLRAPTPTAAAELVAKDRVELLNQLDGVQRHMTLRVQQRLDAAAQRLDQAAFRLSRPAQVLGRQRQQLALLEHRLLAACRDRVRWAGQNLPALDARMKRSVALTLERAARQLQSSHERLESLSPARVLERGYAWLQNEQGHPVVSAAEVAVGQPLQGVLRDGVLQLNVTGVERSGSR